MARTVGAVWVVISLVGIVYAGFQIDLPALLFAVGILAATIWPQRWYFQSKLRLGLLLLLLAGFLSPIRTLVRHWPDLLASPVQLFQVAALALFLVVVGLSIAVAGHTQRSR